MIRIEHEKETTFNGCDQGNLTNLQITEADLCELGVGLLSSISMLKEQILRGDLEKEEKTDSIGSNSSYSSDNESFSLNSDTD